MLASLASSFSFAQNFALEKTRRFIAFIFTLFNFSNSKINVTQKLASLAFSLLHSLNCTTNIFPTTTCPAIFQRGCVIFNRAKAAANLSPQICLCCSEIYASKLANFPKKNLKTLRSVGPSGLPRAALEKKIRENFFQNFFSIFQNFFP